MKDVKDYVRTIPDFPAPGIMFRDITTVIQDPEGFKLAIDEMDALLDGLEFDAIACTESRGFIFGAPIAYKRGCGVVLIRKKGKLPAETISEEYELEYGTAEVEIHKDAIKPGQRIVLIDDLIATGGTVEAAIRLVERLGGEVVRAVFLLELAGLHEKERLRSYDVETVITYPGI